MDSNTTTLAAAAVGATATIAAAVYTVRASRAMAFGRPKRDERAFLSGKWKGRWRITHPASRQGGLLRGLDCA